MSAIQDQEFTEVYLGHYAHVLGYLLRRSASHDARDAAAEVFTVAWRRFDEMPQRDGALPWLYGVAAHVLANQRRGDRRRSNLKERLGGAAIAVSVLPDSEAGLDPELAAALNALREGDRELVLLNAWEGLPASQIALTLEISVAAAEKRLSRAKARLGHALSGTERNVRPETAAEPAEGGT